MDGKEDILGDNKNKRESSFEKYTFKTELSDAELETLVAQENVIKDTLFDDKPIDAAGNEAPNDSYYSDRVITWENRRNKD